MNVLIVCGQYPDNVKSESNAFVHAQAKALKKTGINVAVLSLDMRSIRRKRQIGIYKCELDGITVYVGSFPCGPFGIVLETWSKIVAQKVFSVISKEFKPDIIHCHFQHAISLENISKRNNIPIITTEHDTSLLKEEGRTVKTEKKAIKAYRASKINVCVSKDLQENIEQFYNGEMEVISNVISPIFKYKATKKEKFIFISIGSLDQRKRFDLTIQAFKKINDKHSDTRLIIIGTGILENYLKNMCKDLEMENKVKFMGYVDNTKLPEVYNSSNCFVLPSDAETFGVVYAEATACGLPVIATKSALHNGIIDDDNGIVIMENNVCNVADAMLEIYENIDKYNSKEISEKAISKFGEDTFTNSLIAKYEQILKSKQ